MNKKVITDYGKRVKMRLVDLNVTQGWLIEKIKQLSPNSYVDGSVLNKIFVGEIKESKLIPLINSILFDSDNISGG